MEHSVGNGNGPRPMRRLSDKIFLAFDQACDQGNLDAAAALLQVAEDVIITGRSSRPGQDRRQTLQCLIAAHERLWSLNNPEAPAKDSADKP
jgi:ABC-type transport system involved in cytochrome c biogenesis ATPase subunit